MQKLLLVFLIALSLFGLGTIPAERINHKVTLNWVKPVGNFDGFNVYRQDCNGNYILLKTVGRQLSAVDYGVIGGETFIYYVTTTYQGFESNPSPIASTTVPY